MRLAIDTQAVFGRRAGIGRYTAELMNALPVAGPEHEYLFLNLGRDVAMRTDRRLKWQQFVLPRRARSLKPDLLHVTGADAPVWKPCPVALTVHDLTAMLFRATCRRCRVCTGRAGFP
jgi:hypothetical protein